jgi:hypothetical protein
VFGPKALDWRGMVKVPITTATGLLQTSMLREEPTPRARR